MLPARQVVYDSRVLHLRTHSAGTRALQDAGIPYSAVQQAVVGYVYGESTCGQRALYQLGLTGIPIYNVRGRGRGGGGVGTVCIRGRGRGRSGVVLCMYIYMRERGGAGGGVRIMYI